MQKALQRLKRPVSIKAAIAGDLQKLPIHTTRVALAAAIYMSRRIDWYAPSGCTR